MLDPIDLATVDALAHVPHPLALWRTWRAAQPGTAESGPIRVYLLVIDTDPSAYPGATGWLQEMLTNAGVTDPQVDTFGPATELPAYQQQARGRSTLLWAANPAGSVRTARVFDSFALESGGRSDPAHPRLSDTTETARVLRYLENGTMLLTTTARENDVLDPAAGPVVPMTFRTDGRWIWTDAVAYYLRTYALSPDEQLLSHIRSQGEPPPVDMVAEHRALAALTSGR
ncbi:hypothetical protein M1L60_33365 [Actinoplanes sp. TRM 88003]|uniref:Uncharacterized protein n=1 Tax=Paractinoplanes aksuensis TaxID=2939490 RepID=A0ABT1DX95_9ACTN|nr:hypothetical protein [Actinoplanes aksuensis]MCO8275484.1 hypothetical protein [Actinoplanes aksuensis]